MRVEELGTCQRRDVSELISIVSYAQQHIKKFSSAAWVRDILIKNKHGLMLIKMWKKQQKRLRRQARREWQERKQND